MLTVAAVVPPRWPGELSGTTLANQHNYYAAQGSLLTTQNIIIIIEYWMIFPGMSKDIND